jgi:hypothetical protein
LEIDMNKFLVRSFCCFAMALTAAPAAAQSQFGTGCPVGANTPVIDMQGDPRVGNEIQYQLLQAPAGATAFLMIGLSNTAFGALPLPLALHPWLGASSTCSLLVSPDALTPIVVSNSGTATIGCYLPRLPVLVGATVFAQWGVVTPAAPGGIAMTPGHASPISRSCWYCGDYRSLTNIQDVRRICSPNWSTCPSIATLNDGFRGTLIGGCRCDG